MPRECASFYLRNGHEYWRKLSELIVALVIAVFAVLSDNPAGGLVKVLGQLRPVVVEFIHCYLLFL